MLLGRPAGFRQFALQARHLGPQRGRGFPDGTEPGVFRLHGGELGAQVLDLRLEFFAGGRRLVGRRHLPLERLIARDHTGAQLGEFGAGLLRHRPGLRELFLQRRFFRSELFIQSGQLGHTGALLVRCLRRIGVFGL